MKEGQGSKTITTVSEESGALVIGASAGGVQAVRRVLQMLPAEFSLPILLVQHIADNGSEVMVRNLQKQLHFDACEGLPGRTIEHGKIYVAPAGYHMLVETNRTIALSVDDPVCFSRPSVDELFRSAARVYKEQLIAVLLTGANSDGSAGLWEVAAYGGATFVQDPEEAEFDVMPRSALEYAIARGKESAHCICSLEQMAAKISERIIRTSVNRGVA